MSLLSIQELSAFYGNFQALFGVSLEVAEGETVAVIGSNGAGKTTFLRAVAGALPVERTAVHFADEPVGGRPAHELVDRGVVMVPEGRKIFPSLSAEENLKIGAFRRRPGPWTIERVYELFPILGERRNQPGINLSGGEQQMLAIGRALMARPKLLLLDEPSLGIAPTLVQQIFAVLKKINELGTTILLIEQDAYLALETAHRGYVLEVGQVTLRGKCSDLLKDPMVQRCYLGI